jgi:hypothetical protein
VSHVRQQLIDAVQTRVTGLTTTGARVYVQRPLEDTLTEAEISTGALRVFDDGDAVDTDGEYDAIYMRRTTLVVIDAMALQNSGLAAKLRTIAAEVETALGTALTVTGKSVQLFYRGVEMSDSFEGDLSVGQGRMRFECVLYTTASAPETLILA